jgi:cytochrome c
MDRRTALLGLAFLPIALAAPARAGERCPTATVAAARALAERAAAHLAAHGAEASLKRFMDPAGGFVEGDLYVFVFDLEGRLVASGGWPETVGARVIGPQDVGPNIYLRMRSLALTDGRGWIDYTWYNPCSRVLEPKASYIIRVGDHIVGVGAYKRPGV